MTRMKAFKIRLAATLAVLLLAGGIVRLLWFPGAYFTLSGVSKLLLILVVVNLVIGPGLSTLVYKPGKRGMMMDLWLLAGAELVALSFALSVIHERQPMYAVFAFDRFEVVTRPEVDSAQIGYAELATRPGHEPRLVYAELPQDPEVRNQLVDDTVFLGKADIDRRPEFWKPYAAGIATLKTRAKPLASLLIANDDRANRVRHWLAKRDASAADYVYLPLRASGGDAAMIVHADVGYPVDILLVDPW